VIDGRFQYLNNLERRQIGRQEAAFGPDQIVGGHAENGRLEP